jgi:hypothetical protein
MKTTVDIPDKLLKSVMKQSGCETIRGAVVTAMEWYNHRATQREAIGLLGTLKGFMSQEDLREMREARDKRHDHRGQQLMDRSASRQGGSRGPVSRRKSA